MKRSSLHIWLRTLDLNCHPHYSGEVDKEGADLASFNSAEVPVLAQGIVAVLFDVQDFAPMHHRPHLDAADWPAVRIVAYGLGRPWLINHRSAQGAHHQAPMDSTSHQSEVSSLHISRHGHAKMSKLHSTATTAAATIPTWSHTCLTHDLLDIPLPAVRPLSAAKGSVECI